MNEQIAAEIEQVKASYGNYVVDEFTNDDYWQLDLRTDNYFYQLYNREDDERDRFTLSVATQEGCDLCVQALHVSDTLDALLPMISEIERS